MISSTHHQLLEWAFLSMLNDIEPQAGRWGMTRIKQTVPLIRDIMGQSNRALLQHIRHRPINQYLWDRAVQSIKNTTTYSIQTIYFHLSQRDFKRGPVKCIAEILKTILQHSSDTPGEWPYLWKVRRGGNLVTALLFMCSPNYHKALAVQI